MENLFYTLFPQMLPFSNELTAFTGDVMSCSGPHEATAGAFE